MGRGNWHRAGTTWQLLAAAQDKHDSQQTTLSRFDLYFRSRAHWNWEVRQVRLQEPGTDGPLAGSAPIS